MPPFRYLKSPTLYGGMRARHKQMWVENTHGLYGCLLGLALSRAFCSDGLLSVCMPCWNSDVDSSERWLLVSAFSPSQGVMQKPSISFQSIIEGTKHFHKDFLIGEGEIFEVYRVEIQNQAYAVKLFKQVRNEVLSQTSIPLLCSYFILRCVIFH